MPYKIELEKFVKILIDNKIDVNIIKKLLENFGVDNNKINELLKDVEPQNVEKDDEQYSDLATLEKDILSLSFDLANVKATLNSLKSRDRKSVV